MLYSHDVAAGDPSDMVPLVSEQLRVSRSNLRKSQERMEKIAAKIEELDSLIVKHAKGYAFERIPRVERNALRIGIYEMLFDEAVPPKVAIAEAMRLARKFGTPEASRFINAILDAVLTSAFPGDEEEDKNALFFKDPV